MKNILLFVAIGLSCMINAQGQQASITKHGSLSGFEKKQFHRLAQLNQLAPDSQKPKGISSTNTVNPSFFGLAPVNDNACNAIMVTVNGGVVTGDNLLATVEANEVVPPDGTTCNTTDGWCEFPATVDNSVWYKFIVPPGGSIVISTCGGANSFDTQLALWDPLVCSNFLTYTFIAGNDDGTGCATTYTSYLPVTGLTPGDTLWVQLDGYTGADGTFDLEINTLVTVVNDQPCNAIPIIVGSLPATFTLDSAYVDPNENSIVPLVNDCESGWCEATNTINNSVWFTFTGPLTGGVSISTCNSLNPFDTQLALYDVGLCSDFTTYSLLKANDDGDTNFCSTSDVFYTSYMQICGLTPGNTYYLLVDGYNGVTGDFTLEINPFSPAVPISVTNGNAGAPTCPNGTNGFGLVQTLGGLVPYQYLWSNGYFGSNLISGPGTYTVTVTEQCGSTVTSSVTIPTANSTLSVTAGNALHICNGTPVTLTASANAGVPNDTAVSFFGYEVNNGSLIKFNLGTLNNPQVISTGLTEAFFAGDLTPSGFYAIDGNTSEFCQLETSSGTKSVLGKINILPGHNWTGMAWNKTDGVLYALSTNGTVSTLYSIDPAIPSSTVITNISGFGLGIWLACSPGGTLFSLDIGTDSIYSLDKTTGISTGIGGIGFDANYAQGADFDDISGNLYMASVNIATPPGQPELYRVDTLTGSATLIGSLPDEIDAFACLPYAPGDLYNYSWSPAGGLSATNIAHPTAGPSATTTYTLTVTDACGTTATGTQEVTVSNIAVSITKTDVSVFGGNDGSATAVPSGGISPYQFLWSNAVTSGTNINIPSGTYTVTVTDAAGCTKTDTVVVSQPIGIVEINNAGFSSLDISPNPSSGQVVLNAALKENSVVDLSVYGIQGQLYESVTLPSSLKIKRNFNLQTYGKGVYIIQLKTNKGIYNQRIVVQ